MSTLDDLFKTTFIELNLESLDVEQTSFDFGYVESAFIDEYCPEILDQNESLMLGTNPLLSQATDTTSLQSGKKVEPVDVECEYLTLSIST